MLIALALGLVMACTSADAATMGTGGGLPGCPARTWTAPAPPTNVLSCLQAGCKWGDVEARYRRYDTLPTTAVIYACNADIAAGPISGGVDACPVASKVFQQSVIRTRAVVLRWMPPTEDIDNQPLVGPLTYNVYYRGCDASVVTRQPVTGTEWTIPLPAGDWCFRVATVSANGEGSQTPEVKAHISVGASPQPPVIVGEPSERELGFVQGTASGSRAAFASLSGGKVGAKVADLSVGPPNQTNPPFKRVQCDPQKTVVSSTGKTVYHLVTSGEHAGAYTTGCISYGIQ